jgi:hypothetical protein
LKSSTAAALPKLRETLRRTSLLMRQFAAA